MILVNVKNILLIKLYYMAGWVRASLLGVRLGSGAKVSPFSKIKGARYLGRVEIGREVSIGKGTYINSGLVGSAIIGKYCSIAYDVVIGPTEHKIENWTLSPYEAQEAGEEVESTIRDVPPPVIEDGVWIAAGVTILRGVRIGKNSIVGAGAVVTRDIPSNQIWGGVPARFIKERVGINKTMR